MWSHLYKKDVVPEEKEVNALIKEYFATKDQIDQQKEKLNIIKKQINDYAEKKGLERIFGEDGYFAYHNQVIKDYDTEQLKHLLMNAGLWQSVSVLDKKKLEKLLKTLPPELIKQIESLEKIKNRKILKAVKKDIEIIKSELQED